MTAPAALDYAVPAYFHPAVAREEWHLLAQQAAVLRFVVVNVHNGVGDEVEALYTEVTEELLAAEVRLVGYIDSAYGERPVNEIVAEAHTYQSRYAISGVFLDQVSAGLELLTQYEKYTLGLRAAGVRFIVLNPGVHPHPGYIDLANVTVTYEGPWDAYAQMVEPPWVLSRPPSRFCHLVHETPHAVAADPLTAMTGRHTRTVCLTEGEAPNVWGRLPTVLEQG
jgi:hypothetical protein